MANIMICNSDRSFGRFSEQFLAEIGHTATWCADPQELELRLSSDVDLVILDMQMPGSGLKTVFDMLNRVGAGGVPLVSCSPAADDQKSWGGVMPFGALEKLAWIETLRRDVAYALDRYHPAVS